MFTICQNRTAVLVWSDAILNLAEVTHSDQWRGPLVISINHVLESLVKLTFANY